MKRFFGLFSQSIGEVTGRNRTVCLVVTGLMIAVSMILEFFTIEIPFAKVNFAFLAIAAVGMFYGPVIAFFAGGMCDILGFMVHPDGGFLPVYILIAMCQGLIYGLVLYQKWGRYASEGVGNGRKFTELYVRLIVARLLDIAIINLVLNTIANMHYGFIPQEALHIAIAARTTKNLLQLVADIPLFIVIMPAILLAYNRNFGKKKIKSA